MCSFYLYILLCNRAPWKNSVTEWFTLYKYIWKKKKSIVILEKDTQGVLQDVLIYN